MSIDDEKSKRKSKRGGKEDVGGRLNKVRFFVSNLPVDYSRKEVSEFFGEFGSVNDVCIARNKDKNGNCFGFVSFSKVIEADSLESQLKYIKMGKIKFVCKGCYVRRRKRWVEEKIGNETDIGGVSKPISME